MTWYIIALMLLIGFVEYWCAISLAHNILRISENRAHLTVGGLVLLMAMLPRQYLLAAFVATTLFVPVILWLGLKAVRNQK